MNRYIEFNAVKFISEKKEWEKEKAALLSELDEIIGGAGKKGTFSRSAGIGDSVAVDVIARDRIQSQINRLDMYQAAYDYAWVRLSDEQRDVLTAFFYKEGRMSKRVREVSKKWAICTDKVYTVRRQALGEIAKIITRRYNL